MVGGSRIRYELEGPEGGELVALLNGIAMSIPYWRPVVSALASAGYRVLCHDLRGQLLSERGAGEYSLEGHARDRFEAFAGLCRSFLRMEVAALAIGFMRAH
jgi:3-oxoadipate enol-lactonase